MLVIRPRWELLRHTSVWLTCMVRQQEFGERVWPLSRSSMKPFSLFDVLLQEMGDQMPSAIKPTSLNDGRMEKMGEEQWEIQASS